MLILRKTSLLLAVFFLLCTVVCLLSRASVVRNAVETAAGRESEARRIAATIRTTRDVAALHSFVQLMALPTKPPPRVAEKGRSFVGLFDFRNETEINDAGESGERAFSRWFATIYTVVKMDAHLDITPVAVRRADIDKMISIVRAVSLDRYAGSVGTLNVGILIFASLTVLMLMPATTPLWKRQAEARHIVEATSEPTADRID